MGLKYLDSCLLTTPSKIIRLAALVPRPGVNLTRYHGVLAPNHRWRAEVTPSGRGWRQARAHSAPRRRGRR